MLRAAAAAAVYPLYLKLNQEFGRAFLGASEWAALYV